MGLFASIIVPTRDRPRELERALRAVLAQTVADWEAIVVDDAGAGGSARDVVLQLADPRIRVTPGSGKGPAPARNRGLALATATMVCWLDDDDEWADPRHLELLEDTARRHRCAFFHRGGWLVPSRGVPTPFDHPVSAASLRRGNTVLTSSIAYPRAAHDSVGMLDESLGGYCDWDLLLRLCAVGLEPHRLPGLAIRYSVHDDSLSRAYDNPKRRLFFERFRAKHGLDVQIANHAALHDRLTVDDAEDG